MLAVSYVAVALPLLCVAVRLIQETALSCWAQSSMTNQQAAKLMRTAF